MRRKKVDKDAIIISTGESTKMTLGDPFVAKVKGTSIQTPRQLLALFKLCGIDFALTQEQVDKLIELGFEHLLEYVEKK